MFKNSKIFAVSLLSFSAVASAFAQTSPRAPKAPTAPQSPQRLERQMQIFTNNDGGGYLGVQSQEVTKDNFAKLGLREVRGVGVEKVIENSPAAAAGLQNGDVIVRVNGEEVTSAKKLTRLVSEIAPDHQAEIIVLRGGGSERKITATVGKRATPTFSTGSLTLTPEALGDLGQLGDMGKQLGNLGQLPQMIPSFPEDGLGNRQPFGNTQPFFVFPGSSRQIGVGVTALNDQLGDYFGVTSGKGILINNVAANSPASKAGLKAGDVITEVDGKTVNQTSDLVRSLSEKKEGDVTLTIVRNKNRQTVKVTPEKMANGNAPQSFTFQTDGSPDNQQRKLRLLMQQDQEDQDSDDPGAPKLKRQAPPRAQ